MQRSRESPYTPGRPPAIPLASRSPRPNHDAFPLHCGVMLASNISPAIATAQIHSRFPEV